MYFWQKKNTNYKLIKYQLGNSSQDTNQKKKKKKKFDDYIIGLA